MNKPYIPPDSLLHGEQKNLCFVFVQCTVCELWVHIYNAVEIKFTVIISLLEWLSSLSTRRCTGKNYTMIDVPVHGSLSQSLPS